MMRTTTAALLATGLLWPVPPAHAAVTATGYTCGMDSEKDQLNQDPSAQAGPVDGGPVSAHDPVNAFANPVHIRILCDVQVRYPLHADVNAASVVSSGGYGTTSAPALVVTFSALPGDTLYLCTAWELTDATGATVRYYYDAATASFATTPMVDCVTAGPSLLGSGWSVQEVQATV